MKELSASAPLEHRFHLSERLNIIRAGVLGANDGFISVAGIVVGVASAHQSQYTIFLAGISGMLAGAFSMGGGEYVSVSMRRDESIASLHARCRKSFPIKPICLAIVLIPFGKSYSKVQPSLT